MISHYFPSMISQYFQNIPSIPYLVAIFTAVLLVKSTVSTYLLRRKMPPGPPGIPILGNALQLPKEMAWLKFTEWKEQYGPIYSLNLAGQPVIIVNDHKTVADLFDRRSNIYSDRPRLIVAGEILTGGIFMVFARYGEIWRKMRRASHEEFNLRACEKYQSAQEKEAALLTLDLMKTPDDWMKIMKLSTASNILTAVYGWPRITKDNEKLVTRIHAHTQRIASSVIPGAFLVEIFPFLKHFPTWMAKWKRDGLEWHEAETSMFCDLLDNVDDKEPSFVRGLRENQSRHELTKKESAWLAGLMFSAGAETTFGTLINFFLAMVLYPDVMRRAQKELDTVVGRDQMPTFADKDKLPYIRAMVKEVLRWRPVGPLAVPRRATEDDSYEGYFIPKGTTVIPNVWAMNRDPQLFSDYDDFCPERFLDKTGQIEQVPPDTHGMGHVTFGFGRRICAGFNFANQVLFIQMATMLWAFNFDKALDEDGNPITPSKSGCIDAGVVVLPLPFQCKLTPRFEGLEGVVHGHLENMGVEK